MAIGNVVPLKRYGKVIVAVAVFFVVLTSTVVVYSEGDGNKSNATEKTIGIYKYDLYDDGTATIKGFGDLISSPIVTIPATVQDSGTTYKVTTVKDSAFNSPLIEQLTIGSNVTTIGASAFSSTGITSLTIPASVTTIGNDAFKGIYSLSTLNYNATNVTSLGTDAFKDIGFMVQTIAVTFGDNVTNIPANLFTDNAKINSLTLGSDIVSIGAHAFDGCSGITTLNLPNTLTSIGDYAFNGCTGITSFSMSSNVETIGAHGFDGCAGITAVFLPGTLTYIGDNAFGGCPSITMFVFGEFGNSITVGEHVFSYEAKSSNATIDYIFKNKGDATEYRFDQTSAKNGVFNNRIYECNEQGKATNEYLTIKFDANGGECDIQYLLTDEDGKLTKLPTATRDGYIFDGWYLNGDKVTVDTVFTDNVTLKAQWAEIPGPEPEPEPEPKVEHSADGTPIAVIFVLVVIVIGMMMFAPYGKE